MRFRVTSIADSVMGGRIASITILMESSLNSMPSVGCGDQIDQFTIVYYVTDIDGVESGLYKIKTFRRGSFKNVVTGARERYVEIGVFINSDGLEVASDRSLFDVLKIALFDIISMERVKLSKVFIFSELDQCIRGALDCCDI